MRDGAPASRRRRLRGAPKTLTITENASRDGPRDKNEFPVTESVRVPASRPTDPVLESPLDIVRTVIPDVLLITPRAISDNRGFLCVTYNVRDYAAAGIDVAFIQDNWSMSIEAGVVRGLHFQSPPHAQDKLIRVTVGSIQDVAVDIRAGSPTFGQHVSVILSAANRRQLFVPKGFAHGFCTLVPGSEVAYKVSDRYAPEHDRGIAWNDPALAIEWQVAKGRAIVSERDGAQPMLANLPEYFRYEL